MRSLIGLLILHIVKKVFASFLEIVSSDVLGPLSNGHQGEQYVVSVIKDYSNFTVVYILTSRKEVVTLFKDYVMMIEADHPGDKLRIFRCDNARAYIMGELAMFCKAKGIKIESSKTRICRSKIHEQNVLIGL